MLLPFRSKNPPESLQIGTIGLLAANVLIFLATQENLVIKDSVALRYGLSADNAGPVAFLSSMFLHGDILHILGNMWFLYLFGFAVEGRLRTIKFLALYFASGYAGGFLHLVVSGGHTPMIGASGAIMGVLGAAMYMFPYGKVDFVFSWGLVYWRVVTWHMYWVAIYYLGFDIFLAFLGGGSVAHFAHIGGAAGGVLMCFLFRAPRDSQQASDAKAMFSETKDLRYLAPRELAAMAQHNPNDTTLVLNWMHRCLRDPMGVSPECRAAFFNVLPQIIAGEPVQATGWALASLSSTPGVIKPAYLLDVASRLERAGDPVTALRLFENLISDPAAQPADKEAALFRLGMICERANNYPRAASAYQQVLDQFPMGPFAGQAKLRLSNLTSRA